MNMEVTFNLLHAILIREKCDSVVNEMENDEVILGAPIKMPVSRAMVEYETHQSIQNNVTRLTAVEGYEELLYQLHRENGVVVIYNVTTREDTYMVFLSEDHNSFIGMLISRGKGLENLKYVNSVSRSRGFPISSRRFYKGTIQPD